MATTKKTIKKATNKQVGRPIFSVSEANKKFVREQAGLGVPQEMIGAMIGCSDDTLRKYFEYELLCGKAETISKVANSLVKNAIDNNNVVAQTFYLKTQARWIEKEKLEITGKDDGPVEISDARAKLLAGIKKD